MIRTELLTPDTWDDLTKLFGKKGAYWGCWCTYWIFKNKEYNNISAQARKNALKILVEDETRMPGLLAYINERPVGWCAISPKNSYARLINSRVIKPVDDQPVWSIVCFFIHKDFRGQGIASTLLQAATKYAIEQGAPVVEGYPVELQDKSEKISPDGAYVGTFSMFDKAGYQKIAETKARSGGKPRVVMRYPSN